MRDSDPPTIPTLSEPDAAPSLFFGLSSKLLWLTVLFVMIAEIAVYVPSIANFRLTWLNDRLTAARTAAMVLDATPSGVVPEELAHALLDSIGARSVAIKTGTQRRLLASAHLIAEVEQAVDLRTTSAYESIEAALRIMLYGAPHTIRVIGDSPTGGQFIETVVNAAPLRDAMLRYSRNILLLSLAISLITATLVYLALHFLFVQPLRRITANLIGFHRDPESATRIITPTQRRDEIGMVENELSSMQRDLVSMLHQKNRLASLGLAVSKINHDLRNLLASAQIISDQLASVDDARVQRFTPKLMRTLTRAIAYCQSTLAYGRAAEAPPVRRLVALAPIVEEVRDSLDIAGSTTQWVTQMAPDLTVDADPEQLFRVLLNLARNARQALDGLDAGAPRLIRVVARRDANAVTIEVCDNGPGVPARARAHLFEAFQSAARPGGTGLGLAIAMELVRAHGGTLTLVEGGPLTVFRLVIPDRPRDETMLLAEAPAIDADGMSHRMA